MSKKALVVFSGGLDSIIAVKTLQAQNIEVTALCFESNFYNAKKASETAVQLGVELRIENIRDAILELSKNPPNGYGKNMNPCIDCHGMMFRLAGRIMQTENFDILATGEVLGQRPFSQNKTALKRVETLAEVEVLRPLSAKLLAETSYEKNGLVDREKLHSISGRTREEQMELVKQYGIKMFPSPGGGCLLTDPIFSDRLRELLDNWPDCNADDVDLLKNGRIFWFGDENSKKILVLVGRHELDNENLDRLAQKGDIVLQLKEMNGPSALIRGLNVNVFKTIKVMVPDKFDAIDMSANSSEQIIRRVAILTGYFAVKARGKEVVVEVRSI